MFSCGKNVFWLTGNWTGATAFWFGVWAGSTLCSVWNTPALWRGIHTGMLHSADFLFPCSVVLEDAGRSQLNSRGSCRSLYKDLAIECGLTLKSLSEAHHPEMCVPFAELEYIRNINILNKIPALHLLFHHVTSPVNIFQSKIWCLLVLDNWYTPVSQLEQSLVLHGLIHRSPFCYVYSMYSIEGNICEIHFML